MKMAKKTIFLSLFLLNIVLEKKLFKRKNIIDNKLPIKKPVNQVQLIKETIDKDMVIKVKNTIAIISVFFS